MGQQANKSQLRLLRAKSDDPALIDKVTALAEAVLGRPLTPEEKVRGTDILSGKHT